MFFFRSRRLRYILGTILLSWMLFILFRFVFYFVFMEPSPEFNSKDILRAWWLGMRFDLRLAVLWVLPLLLLAAIPRWGMVCSTLTRKLGKWIYGILIVLSVLFYTLDLGYYAYLQQRVDVSAISLLKNPLISLHMVWESYPVIWLLLIIIALCAFWISLHSWLLRKTIDLQTVLIQRYQKISGVIFGGILSFFMLWGSFAQYALLWSDAFFSQDPFITALALNPVLYFYDTITINEPDFDENRVREFYPLMAEWLGVDNPNSDDLNFIRSVKPERKWNRQPNVLIIFMESVGLNRMGLVGNPLNPTPNLDKLAGNGLFFPKFYVPWVGTARSVFTMITGVPDVSMTETSSRNPLIRDQYSIISEFKEYEKYYLIGGSASWANIRSLITYNLQDMALIELGNFDRPRVDVWGISDLDLFREAHDLLVNRNQQQPFFAVIQTAGNHLPYSIPDDTEGFMVVEVNEPSLQEAGFSSLDQFNAMRLLDHSIGKFMEMAQTANYFKNTIFVFFGDHGTSDPQAEHMSAADHALRLRSYHVPFIIYAPELDVENRQFETVCSLQDLMPTIAGLCGIEYVNKTMGRDVLKINKGLAFIVNKKLAPTSYGVLDDAFYLRIFKDGSGMELHNLNSSHPVKNILSENEELVTYYEKMTLGIQETAKYMLYHNRN